MDKSKNVVRRQFGLINEVKVTSQGVGEPFTNGELIHVYEACSLKGTIYMGKTRMEVNNL